MIQNVFVVLLQMLLNVASLVTKQLCVLLTDWTVDTF